jgi:hypothetical protein
MESSRSAQCAGTQRRPCKLKTDDTAAEYQSWRQKAMPTVKTAHGPALNKTKNGDSIATKGVNALTSSRSRAQCEGTQARQNLKTQVVAEQYNDSMLKITRRKRK